MNPRQWLGAVRNDGLELCGLLVDYCDPEDPLVGRCIVCYAKFLQSRNQLIWILEAWPES